jgi:nicotinate-nucleotide adenylyltransferase
MLYLAVEDRVGLEVSTLEIAHDGICYTIDTLRALRDGTPSCAPLFLCGSDALADIPSWREHEALLAEFDFAAVIRPDETGAPRDPGWPEVVSRRLTPLAKAGSGSLGAGGHVYPLDLPALPISSSLVRARCRQHQPMADVVPARVARYIQRHRLYLEEAAR